MNQWKSVALVVVLSANALSLSACSDNSQFLKSMSLSVSEQNSESYIKLAAEVDLGNVLIDGVQIPVYDPHTQVEIGQVSLGAGPNGKELITLALNASSILHADPRLGSTLPNGRLLPSSVGIASGEMLAIPVLEHSRVYIGGDLKTSIVVGVALALQSLDSVTGSAGLNANIFFSQIFNPNLSGTAGIYASGTAHQNGIAVFGKYTAPVTAPVVPVPSQLAQKTAFSAKGMETLASVETGLIPSVSVSGVTSLQAGNTIVNDQMSKKRQERLYKYFYGKKRLVRPH